MEFFGYGRKSTPQKSPQKTGESPSPKKAAAADDQKVIKMHSLKDCEVKSKKDEEFLLEAVQKKL